MSKSKTFAKIRVQKRIQIQSKFKIITTVHVSQTTTKPLSTPKGQKPPWAVHFMGRCVSLITEVLCEVRAKHGPMRDGHTPVPEDSISYSAVTATKCPSRSNRMVHFGSHFEGTGKAWCRVIACGCSHSTAGHPMSNARSENSFLELGAHLLTLDSSFPSQYYQLETMSSDTSVYRFVFFFFKNSNHNKNCLHFKGNGNSNRNNDNIGPQTFML